MSASSFDFESPNPAAGGPSLSSATPAAVGTAAAGSGTAASKDDHVHAHGNQAGGTLHANAVASGAAGFLSGADKARIDVLTTAASGNKVLASPANGSSGTPDFRALDAADIPSLDASKIAAGTLAFARLPAIYPGVSFSYATVNVGAGRYPTVVGVQTGAGSGTTTASSAHHLYLPASTTWRLQMITSYSYGGGALLRGSVRTASAWGGTYSEAAFVATTSGGINSVFTVDFIVGGSPLVAIFECYHASSGINNVVLRFFQVG